ncbi:MAG TPA: SRPBCC domain-containing protein [Gaiellaceae bacterium]|nr:SRPBCC domain-containing protein [Gaiellaceae bacterium]
MTPPVLRVQRRIAAPPEAVFDAWTHPDVLRDWWSASPELRPGSIEVDLRVGGRYRLTMVDADGVEHVAFGEYVTVSRPERLAFTWSWEESHADAVDGNGTLVEVEFTPDGDGTLVTLTHTGFRSEESRTSHERGWTGCLDSLERRMQQ